MKITKSESTIDKDNVFNFDKLEGEKKEETDVGEQLKEFNIPTDKYKKTIAKRELHSTINRLTELNKHSKGEIVDYVYKNYPDSLQKNIRVLQ